MRQTITVEQADDLRGIIKDIYVQHNLGHIYKTAHLIPETRFGDEPSMNVIMVFTDESNETFLSKDKRARARTPKP